METLVAGVGRPACIVSRADADFVVRLDVHHLMPCGNAALIGAGRAVMARALPDLQAALARKAASRGGP